MKKNFCIMGHVLFAQLLSEKVETEYQIPTVAEFTEIIFASCVEAKILISLAVCTASVIFTDTVTDYKPGLRPKEVIKPGQHPGLSVQGSVEAESMEEAKEKLGIIKQRLFREKKYIFSFEILG